MPNKNDLYAAIKKAAKLNKYNLTPKTVRNLKILNREKISEPVFWRNNAVSAWCILENTAKNSGDHEFCTYNDYWFGIYDEEATNKRKIHFNFSSYGGMCGYNFTKFFDPNTIENKDDLEIQEKFIKKMNYLLDEGILGF